MTVPMAPSSIELAGVLVGAAEEGVGRRADAQALAVGEGLEVQAVLDGEDEGLLGVDVLAGLEDGGGDAVVGVGDGEVDDDVDGVVDEEGVDGLGLDVEFLGALLGGGEDDVGDGADLEAAEERREAEVGGRDVAAADDPDAELVSHLVSSFDFRVASAHACADNLSS